MLLLWRDPRPGTHISSPETAQQIIPRRMNYGAKVSTADTQVYLLYQQFLRRIKVSDLSTYVKLCKYILRLCVCIYLYMGIWMYVLVPKEAKRGH